MSVLIIFILALAVLLVIFTLQNPMTVSINIFFWEIPNAPLVLVLMCCLVLGYIVALIYFYPRLWKVKRQYAHTKKSLIELQQLYKANGQEGTGGNVDAEGVELGGQDGNSFFND
ncbi:MAG: LapA family protein [Chlorobi bacterium]|nr:LapA family protein [Chlorobiota bacterium]